jgi:hypothetical protein
MSYRNYLLINDTRANYPTNDSMRHMHTLYISYLYNAELQLVCDNFGPDTVLK